MDKKQLIYKYCCTDLREILGKIATQSTETIIEIVQIILKAYEDNRTIFICGNGGSASTSSHFACDLSRGTIVRGKKRLKVISLTDNIPMISAWANDTEYKNIFSEQLKNLLQEGDVVIGISGSGRSRNVLYAIRYARETGAVTVGLTGMGGGILKNKANIPLIVPSYNMQQIEDVHLILCHLISLLIKEELK